MHLLGAVEEKLETTGEGQTYITGSRLKDNGYNKRIYKRSELHITEMTETMCNDLSGFGLSTANGTKKYVKMSGGSFSNVTMNSEVTDTLKSTCSRLLGKFEDDMIEMFRKEDNEENHAEFALKRNSAQRSPRSQFQWWRKRPRQLPNQLSPSQRIQSPPMSCDKPDPNSA
eukprot:TRINITY_DN2435_c0_g1_i1.p1 TRINITY_DN2435_c0_g1~~TRINITY_DN2435_c0_g1_i1.p1  ORF type:complete len:171 (-),score=22.29 TRINITY_DN2435_c0_g1_i1:69-581(-)